MAAMRSGGVAIRVPRGHVVLVARGWARHRPCAAPCGLPRTRGRKSSYASCLTADYVAYDDLPWADEEIIREHAAELIAMAESLGLSDLRYASSNRIVVTLTDHVEPLGEYKFSERASFMLGHQIRAYSDAVLKNPGVSPDLLAATPL
jgi:hypothetical protein